MTHFSFPFDDWENLRNGTYKIVDDVDMELPDFIDSDEIEARAEDLEYSANQYYR